MNQPSVKKNYIYRLLYEILILIMPFITTPYVSRVLGADGVGIYSFTTSIMSYFTLFAALGTASYGAREIAQHRDDKKVASKLFWEIELMTVGTSLICLVIWIIFILFSTEYKYYYVALIPTLLSTMVDISWYFTGYEEIKYIVLRNTICKLLGVVLLFLLVREKNDLLLYVIINSSVQLIGNLTMWTYIPKMVVKIDFHTLTFKKHFKETLVYFIPTIATSVYTILDKTLIGLITESTFQNGYYEQATKIINIVKTLVFTSVNSVMGARISYLFAEKKYNEIHHRIERSMDFIFLLGFGCIFGIIGISKNFVPLFFGKGYEPVISLLYLMAPLILIIGISNCLGSQYYTPSGQRKLSAKIIVLGSCINLCMNLICIPFFGAVGATIGSIIAESTISILYVKMSNNYMTSSKLWKYTKKRLFASTIMLGVIFILDIILNTSLIVTICIQVILGSMTYIVLLLIMKDSMLIELLNIVLNILKNTQRRFSR